MIRLNHWLLIATALLAPAALAAAAPPTPAQVALAEQWSDLPDYAALLQAKPKYKVPPRLVSGTPPELPFILEAEKEVAVDVVIAITERGEVAAVRVAKSDDARIDPLAIAAISKWKFAPAENDKGPVKSVARLPLRFAGSPVDEQNEIHINVGEFTYDTRRISISAPVLLTGPAMPGVKAARVVVTSAVDDTGAKLTRGAANGFSLVPADSTAAEKTEAVPPSLIIGLRKPAAGASQLSSLTGAVELVIPDLDPDATAQITQLPNKLGRPLSSPALAAAGITVIVLDQKRCKRALTDAKDTSGARSFLTNTITESTPGWKSPAGIEKMTNRDVALAIHDPRGRLAGLEFQTMHGSVLQYDHNGWSHFEISKGKRFSIYRLNSKISGGIKLMCWLVTPKSLVKSPLEMANVPLPAVPVQ